eukprot:g4199.t1
MKDGLVIGFCGSLTTFSGFMQNANCLIVRKSPMVEHWIACIFVNLAASLTSFQVGEDLSLAMFKQDSLDKINRDVEESKVNNRQNSNQTFVSVMVAFLLLLCSMLIGFAVDVWHDKNIDEGVWLALLLSPIGAICRFVFALHIHVKKMEWFPYGTFFANCLGVAILSTSLASYDLEENKNSCNENAPWDRGVVVIGITSGLCGCLSTVSSFVGEIMKIRKGNEISKAYTYMIATVLTGQIIASIPTSIVLAN